MSYIHRAPISQETKDRIYEYAERTQINENNELVSPNGTGQFITTDTRVDIGHKEGFENRYEVEFSSKAGLTQEQHNILFSNSGTFQLEPHDENISHDFECKDKNEGMANVTAYACSQDKNVASNVYINQSEDRKSGTLSTFDENGMESTLCTYELPGNGDIHGANLESGNNLNNVDTNSDYLSESDTTTNTSVEDNSDDDSDAAINDDSDDNTESL